MKLLNSVLLSVALLLSLGSVSNAAQTNNTVKNSINFTSCLTPTGTVVANYADGAHGIPGQGSRIGKDTVYLMDNGNAMQCFCGSNGGGIQTNWLKTAGYSEDEIKVMQSQGWIFIPTGAAWGLTDEPYLAKNIDYSCSSSSSGGSSGGDGRTDGRTDGRSDGLGSIVQAASGNLASTGNLLFIFEVFALGVFLTGLGLFLRFRSR